MAWNRPALPDSRSTNVTIRTTPRVRQLLEQLSEDTGESMSNLGHEALERLVREQSADYSPVAGDSPELPPPPAMRRAARKEVVHSSP